MNISGKTVELRDHRLALDPLRFLYGLAKTRPVIALSIFNLGELPRKGPAPDGVTVPR